MIILKVLRISEEEVWAFGLSLFLSLITQPSSSSIWGCSGRSFHHCGWVCSSHPLGKMSSEWSSLSSVPERRSWAVHLEGGKGRYHGHRERVGAALLTVILSWARSRLLPFKSCSSPCSNLWAGLRAASLFLTLFLDHSKWFIDRHMFQLKSIISLS